MRQRKTIMTLLVIAGILALGIAYAAISGQQLQVTGSTTASTSDANFDVSIGGLYVQGCTYTNYEDFVTIKTDSSKKVDITISGFTKKGEYVTVEGYVSNDSPQDIDAKLSYRIENDNTDWWEIGSVDFQYNPIAKDESTVFQVTIELKDTPVTDTDIENAVGNFTIYIDAEAQ